jgi:hypothetical protein
MKTKSPGSRQPGAAEVKRSRPEATDLCTSFKRIAPPPEPALALSAAKVAAMPIWLGIRFRID